MPTGYTDAVGRGVVTDFRTFALRCARNFGATIMQRDNPMDELPKHREPSTYNRDALAKARAEVERLAAMTLAEAEVESQRLAAETAARNAKYVAEKRETRQRYEAMIAEVEKWTPPTAQHESMKTFMLQQLRESINWDCSEYAEPEPLLGKAWLAAAQDAARKDVAYHAKAEAEEQTRCAESNAWIDALYGSLPAPERGTP